MTDQRYFFCGIGGSGMMPLAMIIAGRGGRVAGSDRSIDQGRTSAKFASLEALGIGLHPQDGSGPQPGDVFVASAAIEASVPDVVSATALGLTRMSRAELLAELFNAAPISIAVGGTSGKSTVTGMIGWILDEAGRDPTIMNGAVMKNYATPDAPFASARVGKGDVFVSEVDESDGSIALYRPTVAVLNNVSLDHKSMEELRTLFGDFLSVGGWSIANADDAEALALLHARGGELQMEFTVDGAPTSRNLAAANIVEGPVSVSFDLIDATMPMGRVTLNVPGRHNIANALAAISAACASGVVIGEAMAAIESFKGLKRRFDVLGTANGITVIDDFAHNPDKIAATLATLKAFPGRLLLFFQPHGFGPLRQMGEELAGVFARELGSEHELVLCDPVYFGGTVDRSRGSDWLADRIRQGGGRVRHIPEREACGDWLVDVARAGDRIVIMGARDDTLPVFGEDVLKRIGAIPSPLAGEG